MSDKKLEFDLDFLDTPQKKSDKSKPERKKVPNATTRKQAPTKSSSAKPWVVVGLIFIILVWLVSLTEKNESPKVPSPALLNSQEKEIVVGEYRCSDSHSRKSSGLLPNKSEEADIENQKRYLHNRSLELDTLSENINRFYVNQYSQDSVNRYNSMVNEYNRNLQVHKNESASLEAQIDQYNAKINSYNQYLQDNCREAY